MSTEERRGLLRIMRAIRERAFLNEEWVNFHYWDSRIREMTEGGHDGC